MKHLWEIKHSYYCNGDEGYSARHERYPSFAKVNAEYGDSDRDLNMLFRWDWKQEPGENIGTLTLCFMQQRHGKFVSVECPVCAADEPAVREFLKPYWDHLRELWEPINKIRRQFRNVNARFANEFAGPGALPRPFEMDAEGK